MFAQLYLKFGQVQFEDSVTNPVVGVVRQDIHLKYFGWFITYVNG